MLLYNNGSRCRQFFCFIFKFLLDSFKTFCHRKGVFLRMKERKKNEKEKEKKKKGGGGGGGELKKNLCGEKEKKPTPHKKPQNKK